MIKFASLIAIIISLISTAFLGTIFLPILKKLHTIQIIKDIGPKWHKAKGHVPTMGGIFLILGFFIGLFFSVFTSKFNSSSFSLFERKNVALIAGCICAFGYGLIGFADDYVKTVKKRNLGITAATKTLFQLIIVLSYFLTLKINGYLSTVVKIPFFGQFDFGLFYYAISILGAYGMVNAVNLTDGVDGLASSVTATYCLVFILISNFLGYFEMNLLASAALGSCLGFLIWNLNPAKVFMGDTGSMFLGGIVIALGFGCNQPVLIIIVGIIYIIEALSVVAQVISFKLTGKRIFKMSPIHHHFELCGWSENKIVLVFSITTAIFGFLGLQYLN